MIQDIQLLRTKVEQIPTIYAYELIGVPDHEGLIKVGFTVRDVEDRINEQLGTAGVKHKTLLVRTAMRSDGSVFDDHTVHKLLRSDHVPNPEGEWFRCSVKTVEQAIDNALEGRSSMTQRTQTFKMRPEQKAAVDKTSAYFTSFLRDPDNKGLTPHFLWNAKMRFGKTFTTYQLAKRMGWTKVLVLTFKPAVKTAWEEDLNSHKDFEGWQFCQNRRTESLTM